MCVLLSSWIYNSEEHGVADVHLCEFVESRRWQDNYNRQTSQVEQLNGKTEPTLIALFKTVLILSKRDGIALVRLVKVGRRQRPFLGSEHVENTTEEVLST